ncbi:MAG: dUTP diphosphatase [Lactobacillales bacterium]|jgi:dUTP pyrophosphatase|nr:dUTP diphosphatase [Lactobacillales bacterium]
MKLHIEYLENYKKEYERVHYKHPSDSAFDLRACIEAPITLKQHEFALIATGIKCEVVPGDGMPPFIGYEIQVRPRSGLAAKNAISIPNSPGTVDFGYRGEIKVTLINHGAEDFTINPGDRIAQAVVCPIIKPEIVAVDKVNDTSDRGSGGFGSTGVK